MATTMPSLPAQPAAKRDTLSTVLMLGTSVFGGGTAAYLIFQLIREQPDQAFKLLQAWGPGYLLALFIAWALNKLLGKAVDIIGGSSERNAIAIGDVAVQMKAMAAAVQSTADKDDRERDRLATLVEYSASQSRQALEQLQALAAAVNRLAAHIDTLGSKGS
jgi:hypothetical protein